MWDWIYYLKLIINMIILKKKKGVNFREDMNFEMNCYCSMYCYNRRYRKCCYIMVYICFLVCSFWWCVLLFLLLLFYMFKIIICISCFKGVGCLINYLLELFKMFWYDIFFIICYYLFKRSLRFEKLNILFFIIIMNIFYIYF